MIKIIITSIGKMIKKMIYFSLSRKTTIRSIIYSEKETKSFAQITLTL